ncbi:MAG: hypothetical protein E4H37_02915 [Gemmatimonadales bacterium]|nr:MAG: hypothetical protein E4H37_02915 [Gemmatimonadales bacterium]
MFPIVGRLMTRDAIVLIGRCEEEGSAWRGVTTGAAHPVVRTNQIKSIRDLNVIEDRAAGPGQRFMALLTLGWESDCGVIDQLSVAVVLLMARNTIRIEGSEERASLAFGVARFAGEL